MHFLIVGLGSIGKRHLANMRQLYPHSFITVWRQHHPVEKNEQVTHANHVIADLAELGGQKLDGAFICNPATLHVETAMQLAKRKVALFIEKPLSHDFSQANQLVKYCTERELVLHVGHVLRHFESLKRFRALIGDPAVMGKVLSVQASVGQYLPDWRQIDYRQSVTARKELGGGALLELCHDVDYLTWILGPAEGVIAQFGHRSALEIDVEDCVDYLLQFNRGNLVAYLHADFIDHASHRRCRVAGEKATAEWNALGDEVLLYEAKDRAWRSYYKHPTPDKNNYYLAEVKEFVEALSNGSASANCTGSEALATIALLESARQAQVTRQFVKLDCSHS